MSTNTNTSTNNAKGYYEEYENTGILEKNKYHEIHSYRLEHGSTRDVMSKFFADRIFTAEGAGESINVLLISTYKGDLVVVRGESDAIRPDEKETPTMTKIKKQGFSDLLNKRKMVKKAIRLSGGETFHVWQKPIHFRAQTYKDMSYGDRYHYTWGRLDYVEEGNKYGDTSLFAIIGYIDRESK